MRIYADHNATAPLLPEVLEAWQQFGLDYGNPASLHQWGRRARQAIEDARAQVAALVSAPISAVHFTSGGTESNHWALKGMSAGRVYVSAIEHDSLLSAAHASHHTVCSLPVNAMGQCDASTMHNPSGVSVMWANNETGVLQDIPTITTLARHLGAWVHTDATQAVGKVPVSFEVDLMTFSAHKIGGPMGVGALVVDTRIALSPLFEGGLQDRAARAGTENLFGIIGFGIAAQIALQRQTDYHTHSAALQQAFEQQLCAAIPACHIFGQQAARLPNTTFFGVPGIDAQMLVMMLDKQGIAVSGGAACGSASDAVSHVLTAMGVAPTLAASAVRVSFGWKNTQDQVEVCVAAIVACIKQLK